MTHAWIPDRLSFLPFKLFANLQRMSGQKFRRAHPSSTFALQFQNPQRVFATTNNNAGFVRLQNLPRPTGAFDDINLPDFEQNGSRRAWSSAFRRCFRPNGIAA